MEERKLCPLRYYANCVSTTLTVLILHNVERVYFFYSNPVYIETTQHFLHTDILHTYQPMKMEETERSETSTRKIQTPGNYPEESINQPNLT